MNSRAKRPRRLWSSGTRRRRGARLRSFDCRRSPSRRIRASAEFPAAFFRRAPRAKARGWRSRPRRRGTPRSAAGRARRRRAKLVRMPAMRGTAALLRAELAEQRSFESFSRRTAYQFWIGCARRLENREGGTSSGRRPSASLKAISRHATLQSWARPTKRRGRSRPRERSPRFSTTRRSIFRSRSRQRNSRSSARLFRALVLIESFPSLLPLLGALSYPVELQDLGKRVFVLSLLRPQDTCGEGAYFFLLRR